MLTRTCKNFSEKISKRGRIFSGGPNQTDVEKKEVRKQGVHKKSIPRGLSFSQAGSRVVSCMVLFLSKADQVSGTFTDLGHFRIPLYKMWIATNSSYLVQLQPSMVKLGVISVPGKHGILLPRSIPAPMGSIRAATRLESCALVLIFPSLAGGGNQPLFLSELQAPNMGQARGSLSSHMMNN